MRGQSPPERAYADLKADEKEFVRKHIQRFFREVEKKKYKVHVRVFMSRYRAYTECPACRGARLRPEALWVRVGEMQHRASIAHEHRAGAGIFRHAATEPGRSRRLPTRCWTRSGSAANF